MKHEAVPNLLQLAGMSETLLPSLAIPFGIMIAAMLLVLAVFSFLNSRFKRSWRDLHAAEGGAAHAADLVLVAVPVLLFITLLVQMTWFMRETVVLHYAAFAAARSAKVHECPIVPAGPNEMALIFRDILCTNEERYPETAARFALISASPPWNIPCISSCMVPTMVVRLVAQQKEIPDQAEALLKQARYAFDTQNVRLRIEIDDAQMALGGTIRFMPGARPAVRAELVFRHYVMKWVGKLIGERRQDGNYYREMRAVVRLA